MFKKLLANLAALSLFKKISLAVVVVALVIGTVICGLQLSDNTPDTPPL